MTVTDFTPVLLALIALIGAVLTYLIKRYALPWLQDNRLVEAAVVAVQLAEVLYGRGHGDEKLQAALDYLAKMGFDIDSEKVIAAIKAAWYDLNINQICVGIKDPPAEEDPPEENEPEEDPEEE